VNVLCVDGRTRQIQLAPATFATVGHVASALARESGRPAADGWSFKADGLLVDPDAPAEILDEFGLLEQVAVRSDTEAGVGADRFDVGRYGELVEFEPEIVAVDLTEDGVLVLDDEGLTTLVDETSEPIDPPATIDDTHGMTGDDDVEPEDD